MIKKQSNVKDYSHKLFYNKLTLLFHLPITIYHINNLTDHELCHSTLKPIGDEQDTLKSFMTFDITSCGSVFRVVVGSQIVVLNTIYKMKLYF